jgi:peptidoglycan/LPS O-acetylase OafA/YrhL
VYHFPLQQALISLGMAAAGAGAFFGQTCVLVLPVAALSWHWVEKPALRWKGRPSGPPAKAR